MADLDNSNFLAGAVLAVEREGTAYTVSQVPHTQDYLNPRVLSGMRKVFQYRVGPLSLNGYVNLQSKEIVFEVAIFGIKLGNFYGHIDDPEGTLVRIDLFQAKGQLRLYTKGGKELWMYEELDIKDSGAYNENIKLAGWTGDALSNDYDYGGYATKDILLESRCAELWSQIPASM